MKSLILTFTVCLFAFSAQAKDSFVKFYPTADQFEVSYYLNEEGQVLARLQDFLRAGETVRLTHRVKVFEDGRWRGRKLAEQAVKIFVDYNTLSNTYEVRLPGEKAPIIATPEELPGLMFGVNRLPLLPAAHVAAVGAYQVRIRVQPAVMQEGGSWVSWLSLENVWQQRPIKAEVVYLNTGEAMPTPE